MNNDNDLNLHCMTKLSCWLRYWYTASQVTMNTVKPLLHDQIFCDKFYVPNVFWQCKLEFSTNVVWQMHFFIKILIYTVKNTWHMKFVKENLVM